MKIGFTERGDAGLDFAWLEKLKTVDGAVLITKFCNDMFIKKVTEAYDAGYPFIVHGTCTGWGNTVIEPNVPVYTEQIDQMVKLVQAGFPKERLVLRIDPIVPNPEGLQRVQNVISYMDTKTELEDIRIRISVLDEYKHVKQRFLDLGLQPVYSSFYASKEQMQSVIDCLKPTGHVFECCAEPFLKESCFIHQGCLSEEDLKRMGLIIPKDLFTNPQQRHGCMCLSCKKELLTEKKRCPYQCSYCYWKEN